MRGVERGCAIKRLELARPSCTARLDPAILVLATQLDPSPARHELKRRGEVEPLLELHQAQHVAPGVTAEALEQLLARRDRERRRALVMQRATAAYPIAANA